jgi:glucuronosyltransferase
MTAPDHDLLRNGDIIPIFRPGTDLQTFNSVDDLLQNLEKWINESAHGVIYFSLGSMIKGHTFPDEKRREFLKAFGRLPQRVLWKWENDSMPGKPDNVMIQKWMPQLDILCEY